MKVKIEFENGNIRFFNSVIDASNYLDYCCEEQDEDEIGTPELITDNWKPRRLSISKSVNKLDKVINNLENEGYEMTYEGKFGYTYELKDV